MDKDFHVDCYHCEVNKLDRVISLIESCIILSPNVRCHQKPTDYYYPGFYSSL